MLIIGDSLLVTCKHTISQDALSERMQLYRVNNLIKQLSTYSLLHFKRENNVKVDHLDNLAATLDKGTLEKHGDQWH